MDTILVKTFLEVAATGSFVSASERLYVTPSAVSLRIQRLEQALGKRLFERSKAGAELTHAGHEFEKYALSLLKVWEEARQKVGIPEGFRKSLTIGAQFSLWPRLGFRWIDGLQATMPDLSLRLELGMPDRLTRFLTEGSMQVGLMYTPQLRPGLHAEKVMDDELVLAATWPEPTFDLTGRYAFINWGEEFVHAHSLAFPELTNPGLTLSLEALGAEFILDRHWAAYLPARYIYKHLDADSLHLVPGAPKFTLPLWSVWRDDLDPDLLGLAKETLAQATEAARDDQAVVMKKLRTISMQPEVATLGKTRKIIRENNSPQP
ncbi:DNA-binding transcriptional LysR family regulator [Limimaricola soesokkakensis]|uniref:DNA-binding transcriptional LysR family regulator n=1 Tax=Limimaricola soesokkakensis TaxID=1343159 RepID=A0A1X7A4X8_9RHOB|nr:LysR family transcriptional regulator [Limimaricola soesokkakensis]PSK80673.1 DNA-binding transcriptional LysR family regulator [Limimaricola soesokkakensis]SLN70731.1 HTH-type transcriptional regulator GltR [Limimaricola soesokkakensis]